MTALADVYMLDADSTKLDYPTLRKILEAGHSRLPVYELSPNKQRRIVRGLTASGITADSGCRSAVSSSSSWS